MTKAKENEVKTHSLIAMISWIASAAIPFHAFAKEGAEGHGGGAWVCRDLNGGIRWATLADLWEARVERQVQLEPALGTVEAELSRARSKIEAAEKRFLPVYDQELSEVMRKKSFIPSEGSLEAVLDANYQVRPKAKLCKGGKIELEQVANFLPDGNLLMDSEIHQAMSSMDQAALLVHEAIYSAYRKIIGAKTSNSARRLTGQIFAKGTPTLSDQPLHQVYNIEGAWSGWAGVNSQMVGDITLRPGLNGIPNGREASFIYVFWMGGVEFETRFRHNMIFAEELNAYCVVRTVEIPNGKVLHEDSPLNCAMAIQVNPLNPDEFLILDHPRDTGVTSVKYKFQRRIKYP